MPAEGVCISNISSYLKLCLVTHPQPKCLKAYEQFILQAINGGVSSVQLRLKNSEAYLKEMALALMPLLKSLNIPLIINDHVALAKEIDADGVHLGQKDCPPELARQMLGPDKIIGWSIENWVQLERANELDCLDYIAASAIFPSKTKLDCKTIWGLEGLKKIVDYSRHPVVAIGGIDTHNVQEVMRHGAAGVALVSAIHDSPHPEQAACELIHQINLGSCDVSAN